MEQKIVMEIKTFCALEFPENCYAAILSDGIFLVDPGEFTEELADFVKSNSSKIKYILLTHKHFDHIRGTKKVKELCPDAKVVIHNLDADGLCDSFKSLATYFGFEQENVLPDLLCNDGDVIDMGDVKILVMHTPGHSEGGVCYVVKEAIFCGDTIFEGSCGRTDFPGGDWAVLSASLKKLKELSGDYILYPGHGNSTKLSDESINNPYMRNL